MPLVFVTLNELVFLPPCLPNAGITYMYHHTYPSYHLAPFEYVAPKTEPRAFSVLGTTFCYQVIHWDTGLLIMRVWKEKAFLLEYL